MMSADSKFRVSWGCPVQGITLLAAVLALASLACFADEPDWKPPLASGGAPACPKHRGSRTLRSATVQDEDITALITGVSRREREGCQFSAEVQATHAGTTKSFKLPEPDEQSYSIVDFSPDGTQLLLATEISWKHANDQHRNVSVTTMPFSNGEMKWLNAWDLLGWKDCDAMVEPQGFTADGRIVMRARKSVKGDPRRPDCVNDVGLYAVDLTTEKVTRLPDSTVTKRYAGEKRPGFQACKSDPDIVGVCFTVHGRLSAWNGAPTMRIWRIGTKRILGVHDGIVPESLAARMSWDVEA